MKTFKTPKGTELPLMDLKGKDYLQVAHRIQWFREEHPDYSIITDVISNDGKLVTIKASIINAEGRVLSTSHKLDQLGSDMLEKCETGAIGRALALCGYGTQFAEISEGDRLSDAPIGKQDSTPIYTPPADKNAGMKRYENFAPKAKEPPKKPISPVQKVSGSKPINFGKYKGRDANDIPRDELRGYLMSIKRKASDENKPMGGQAADLLEWLDEIETNQFLDDTTDPYPHSDGPPLSSYDPNEQMPF